MCQVPVNKSKKNIFWIYTNKIFFLTCANRIVLDICIQIYKYIFKEMRCEKIEDKHTKSSRRNSLSFVDSWPSSNIGNIFRWPNNLWRSLVLKIDLLTWEMLLHANSWSINFDSYIKNTIMVLKYYKITHLDRHLMFAQQNFKNNYPHIYISITNLNYWWKFPTVVQHSFVSIKPCKHCRV